MALCIFSFMILLHYCVSTAIHTKYIHVFAGASPEALSCWSPPLRDIWPCYFTFQIANDKGADQTARMRRLICAFVVRNQEKSGFLVSMPIWCWKSGFLASAWLRAWFAYQSQRILANFMQFLGPRNTRCMCDTMEFARRMSQYVNWNKHPVPILPSLRHINMNFSHRA